MCGRGQRRLWRVAALLVCMPHALALMEEHSANASPKIHLKTRVVEVLRQPRLEVAYSAGPPPGGSGPPFPRARRLMHRLRAAFQSPLPRARSGPLPDNDAGTDTEVEPALSAWKRVDPRWHLLTGKFQQYMVALHPPVTRGRRAMLEAAAAAQGGWIAGYLPEDAFLVAGPASAALAMEQLPGVVWVGSPHPHDKLPTEWPTMLQWTEASPAQNSNQHPPFDNSTIDEKPEPPSWVLGGESDPLHHMETRRMMGKESVAVVLEVSLVPWAAGGNSSDVLEASRMLRAGAAAEWVQALLELTDGGVEAHTLSPEEHARGSPGVQLSVQLPHLKVASEWLATQEAVHYVSPQWRMRTSNHFSSSILQSGAATASGFGYRTDATHPFWGAGITGAGQVVGVGDTGLDIGSCFFIDSGVAVGPEHRKLLMYDTSLGDAEDAAGHGSHVAGSVAGMAVDSATANRYAGMAPEARLAFHDLQTSGYDTLTTLLSMEAYYQKSYNVGARIHSDSWGFSTGDYNQVSQQVDRFTFNNEEFLPIFAAGNFGTLGMSASVTAPSTSKNCLSVGATLGPNGDNPLQTGNVFVLSTLESSSVRFSEKVIAGEFGPEFGASVGSSWEVEMAEPVEACSELTNAAAVTGKLVLIYRGTCHFTDKVRAAQQARAAGVIVVNRDIGGFVRMGAPSWDSATDVTIPSGAVPLSTGLELERIIRIRPNEIFTLSSASLPSDRFSNIAEFSSIGPTPDTRIKPDITAPGEEVQSAASSRCSTSRMSGTSSSAPLVAGMAALVRQYFQDGFHPSGSHVPEDGFVPTGPLVKAVLLNGAVEMDGFTESGLPLEPSPSTRQGFGRLKLGSSLPLANDPNTVSKLFVVNSEPIDTGDVIDFCVSVERATAEELRATLVWHDPPALLGSRYQLVNDLDLQLKMLDPSQSVLGYEAKLYGNRRGALDRVNNVERIRLEAVAPGTYVFEVSAHQIRTPPQRFSLVVTGPFRAVIKCDGATIISKPDTPLAGQEATFAFRLMDTSAQGVMCRLHNETAQASQAHDWVTCTSPLTYTGLQDGGYTFSVRAWVEDGASVPSSYSFVVDTTAPVTELREDLEALPYAVSLLDEAEFYFSASREVTPPITYMCQLVAGDSDTAWSGTHPFEPCESPKMYSNMASGGYVFTVRATDGAGNVDAIGASHAWQVDANGPQTYITVPPPQIATTPDVNISFGTDLDGVATTFECKLRTLPIMPSDVAPFFECTSPHKFTALADGLYEFSVRAVRGAAKDFTPAKVEFRVDSGMPRVSLTQTPGATTRSTSLSFHFASNCATDQECVLFCELRDAITDNTVEGSVCTSPKPYLKLDEGHYRFRVKATDTAVNLQGPFTTSDVFVVDRSPPVVSVTRTVSPTAIARVHFTSTDGPMGSGVSSTRCRLSGLQSHDWMECSSPVVYSDDRTGQCLPETRSPLPSQVTGCLKNGEYSLEIVALDLAGNQGIPSVPVQISVDVVVPVVQITGVQEPGGGGLDWDEVRIQFRTEDTGVAGVNQEARSTRCRLARVSDFGTFLTPAPLHDFRECSESQPLEYSDLPPGQLIFRVQAEDEVGNIGFDEYTFTVNSRDLSAAPAPPSSNSNVTTDVDSELSTPMFSQMLVLIFIAGLAVVIASLVVSCIWRSYKPPAITSPPSASSTYPGSTHGMSIANSSPYPAPLVVEGTMGGVQGMRGAYAVQPGTNGFVPNGSAGRNLNMGYQSGNYHQYFGGAYAPAVQRHDHLSGTTMVQCPICNGHVPMDQLNRHLDEAHMMGSQSQSMPAEDSHDVASTVIPSQLSGSAQSLTGVILNASRSPQDSVTCPMCRKVCINLHALNVHLDTVHAFVPPNTSRPNSRESPTPDGKVKTPADLAIAHEVQRIEMACMAAEAPRVSSSTSNSVDRVTNAI